MNKESETAEIKKLIIYVDNQIENIKELGKEDTEKVAEIANKTINKVLSFNATSLYPERRNQYFNEDKMYIHNQLKNTLTQISKNNIEYIKDNFWFVKFFLNGSIKFLR